MRRTPISLALGGGGARGLAHLGVLEEMQAAHVDIQHISGVSMGGLIGAMYAFDPRPDRIRQRALDYLLSDEFSGPQRELLKARSFSDDTPPGGLFSWYHQVYEYLKNHHLLSRISLRQSLLPGYLLEDAVNHLLPAADIEEAVIPLTIVAADLHTGRRVLLETGDVRSAARASAALPGIFPPVVRDDMLLCDVGVVDSVPILPDRRQDCVKVAVDVSGDIKPLRDCLTTLDVLMRLLEISEVNVRQMVLPHADLVISPEVGDVEWYDFSSADVLFAAGREATRTALRDFPPPLSLIGRLWNRLFADRHVTNATSPPSTPSDATWTTSSGK
ncbi:MAG: patatin-like phospholipase family protein [Planctomycetaceae bacterium]|nr:patatin-like phospholipase family protein [Planctomycetaceae bacterium]